MDYEQAGGTEEKQDTVGKLPLSRQEHFQPLTRQEDLNPIPRPDHQQPIYSRQEAHIPVSRQKNHLDSRAPQAQSTTTATLDRLRQLGVSFISPEDLSPSAAPSSLPYNSVYLPQAIMPSATIFSPSPDTSLAVNSMALKYLSDTQLTRLAVHHSATGKTDRPADFSLASHQFLARHGLGEDSHGTGHRPHNQNIVRPVGSPQQLHQQRQNIVQFRPQIHQLNHPGIPNQQNGPPQFLTRPTNQQTNPPAAPEMAMVDRVLDITAIRQQSKLL